MPALRAARPTLPECRLIDGHTPFAIGGLEVQPFPVPHDAREPVQYAFSDGQHRLGVLTDSGSITPHIVEVWAPATAWSWSATTIARCSRRRAIRRLKQRIGGRFGHLENDQAAALLRQVDTAAPAASGCGTPEPGEQPAELAARRSRIGAGLQRGLDRRRRPGRAASAGGSCV
jgi:hypothetical protein